ncbi:CsiV family protein [Microbulbifer yueqingensis]|uniref:Peptidoglycan-binding protein, CsiV n=1 Tax=Microbulbifer yueqingensis TaxID=658219 RepID=A0A1G9A666_9GAMM|nr:CsiV family protein [Microbulbifer yueqingensis]SDK22859.1 Peptidoglycan-binding protein, CsiV [Microbulbifer yueqingensis]
MRLVHLCTALLLALTAAGTQAASYAGTTFEIEMIVFSRTDGMSGSRENWPASPRLSYPAKWIDFTTTGGEGEPQLVPAATQLDNKAAALQRSGNYRVLFHKAWQQQLWQKRRAPAILIEGGDTYAGHSQLEGSIKLSVSRYLHLSTNLWMSEFGEPGSEGGILLPKPSSLDNGEPLDLAAPGAARTIASQGRPGPVYAARVAQLQQERRMRSGELHYLDHPRFGVLVQVRTLDKPEDGTPAAGN